MSAPERPFEEQHMPATWLEQFELWFADVRDAQLPEPTAMVLATADEHGHPAARTVLLKGVDGGGFVFFTNLQSRKGRQLAANPWASLVFPWHPLQRQVIVTGRAQPVDDAEADAYFATRAYGSQIGAHASRQSTVVPDRAFLENAYEQEQLRHPPDGAVPRPVYWSGFRVIPDAVEFWRGRPDRLHDRLRYRLLDGERWTLERLSP
jgi:pyridoxamine 5'-phosphate oxidase